MPRLQTFRYPADQYKIERPDPGNIIGNYTMAERAQRPYFGIHDNTNSLPNPVPHRHEYYQIYVNINGNTTHYLGCGQRPVVPGTLCFIAPFLPHYIRNPDGARFYVINASQDFLFPALEFDPLEFDPRLVSRAAELGPFLTQDRIDFVFDRDDIVEIETLCEVMKTEAAHDDIASSIFIRSCLLKLIGLVWRRHGDAMLSAQHDIGSRKGGGHVIAKLGRYIISCLDKEITLATAARACHVSPTHLAHLIKRETGQTFLQIVTHRRIELAKSYLVFSALSVKEICTLTGFGDASHFARRFKQITGVSPSDYKNKHQSLA
ncbi:AraC family transcriptional regulator [Noviherbaspirillum denitrificans]|nr:AraC family transcriptional regulator [Noviherbaspirillum denitrificans]